MDPETKQKVDAFAHFLSDLADRYDITTEDYIGIFRGIGECFGGIVVTDDGKVREE